MLLHIASFPHILQAEQVLYKMLFPNSIIVASENAEWLVTLENHEPQCLVSKHADVKPCKQETQLAS